MAFSPRTRRTFLSALSAAPAVAIAPRAANADAADGDPATMQQADLPTLPAVAHVGPSAPAHLGKATAIMVDTADVPGDLAAGLWRTAELLAEDLAKELDLPRRPQIRQGTVAAHAVGLRLSSQVDSPEGYILHTDGATVITGADPAGVYWGTQTLVQLVRGAYEADSAGGRGVELQAHVIDSPEHGERAVNAGLRPYFSPKASNASFARCPISNSTLCRCTSPTMSRISGRVRELPYDRLGGASHEIRRASTRRLCSGSARRDHPRS